VPGKQDQGNDIGETSLRAMESYGTGDEPWFFTSESDTGLFSIAVVTAPDAKDGGFKTIYSCVHNLREIADIYHRVPPQRRIGFKIRGSVGDLGKEAVVERKRWGRGEFWKYHRLFFPLYTLGGVWNLKAREISQYLGLRASSMELFLRKNFELRRQSAR
jgi:hypothetical protein